MWQALARFRGDSSVKTFVLRVAHNRALSHAWKRTKQQTQEAVDVADPRPPADELVAANQQAEELLARMRTIPLGQRQVLALALEGLAHAEISAVLGISIENVAVRLGRARASLKKRMEEHHG